jgi:sulfite exporter TauE/SafE/copper chaperone CopZ
MTTEFMAKIKKTTLYVEGMHCPSCEVLINDKFSEEGNVKEVNPNFKNQKVEVLYTGSLDHESLNRKIVPFGYRIGEKGEEASVEPLSKRIFEAVAIGSIVFILYLIASELGIVPDFNITGSLSLWSVLVIGLVASTSTCMATSGALFLSTVGKGKNNLSQALFFNAGRIASYGAFGFLAGLVGQALITNLKFGPYLTLLAAVFMVLLGLDMAKILSIGAIIPSGLNKKIFQSLEHKLMKYPRKAPFLLGAITYLLPCGFTQAVQVYALGLASPLQSALTMVVFAIGTAPALMLIGGLTSLTKTTFYSYFMKAMGVIVFIIGFGYFSNFLSLYNININPFATNGSANSTASTTKDGVQTIDMRVVASGYVPNSFTVKKGVPVKWNINGENTFGCQAYFVVPTLGIQKTIVPGIQTIDFTPTETGTINFSCGMGMYRGQITVIN